jgi:hypothetical protein
VKVSRARRTADTALTKRFFKLRPLSFNDSSRFRAHSLQSFNSWLCNGSSDTLDPLAQLFRYWRCGV